MHAAVGVAIPYGNSKILPYEKRYFSGGANSVRGWSVRTLGPGTFRTEDTRIDFNNQSGDIKLDLNMEYRVKIVSVLEGALFLDAGNIWTIKEYETQPGGAFRFDSFYKQIAVAYGVGVRLNLSFFILRLDFGVKLHDPALADEQRWRIKPKWKDDMAFHFAIGYPF
jgi:outer membrane protein assembly factor BamA